VRFININVTELDSSKHCALPLNGDAKATLQEWLPYLSDWRVSATYAADIARQRAEWNVEVDRLRSARLQPIPCQAEIIDVLNQFLGPKDVIICAAGSLPGDLHKLWRCHDPKSYHLEYGYSCMGYEIPAAIGVRMADPSRDVYAIIGDGNYLMMSQEIVTSIQEGVKITIVVLDNHGYASIGGLSESLGCKRFGTQLRTRSSDGSLSGPNLQIRFEDNASSLGAFSVRISTTQELVPALTKAKECERTTVIVLETQLEHCLPSYETWWDVPICETSMHEGVQNARREYERRRQDERYYLSSL
jgi:3D-(3,5/4)-trihydroxycyclohexane-1,2-dione acylhydrolase (decyclizing)